MNLGAVRKMRNQILKNISSKIYKLIKKFTTLFSCYKRMNNNYFEHDENVQMAPPNYLGLRNQFFLFITFLKNSEHISVTFSAFTLLAILVINSFFSVYPLVPYIYGAVGEDPYDDYVLKLNSQSVFSTFLFYLCHVITDITIIIFFVCLYNPNLTIKLHWVLHPQVHIIVLPFISMVFSMCIFVFTNNDDDSFVLSFLSLSFILSYSAADAAGNRRQERFRPRRTRDHLVFFATSALCTLTLS